MLKNKKILITLVVVIMGLILGGLIFYKLGIFSYEKKYEKAFNEYVLKQDDASLNRVKELLDKYKNKDEKIRKINEITKDKLIDKYEEFLREDFKGYNDFEKEFRKEQVLVEEIGKIEVLNKNGAKVHILSDKLKNEVIDKYTNSYTELKYYYKAIDIANSGNYNGAVELLNLIKENEILKNKALNYRKQIEGYAVNKDTDEEEVTTYDVSNFKEVTLGELLKLGKGKNVIVGYIGKSTCPYCVKLVPTLNKSLEVIDEPIYYVDATKIDFNGKDFAELEKLDSSIVRRYPTLIGMKEGKIIQASVGNVGYDSIISFYKKIGLQVK